jgi:hypothetical protein
VPPLGVWRSHDCGVESEGCPPEIAQKMQTASGALAAAWQKNGKKSQVLPIRTSPTSKAKSQGLLAFHKMPHRAASPAVSENEFDITKSLFNNDEGDDGDNFGVSTGKDVGDLDAGGIFDSALESDGDGDEAFIAAKQAASNRKASNVKGKSVKKGGGFQAMGTHAYPPHILKPSLIMSRLEFAPLESDQ